VFLSKKLTICLVSLLAAFCENYCDDFDYHAKMILMPSCYTDKITVRDYREGRVYHLSFDQAFAYGILHDNEKIIQEAVYKQWARFSVDEIFDVIANNIKDTRLITGLKIASGVLAAYGFYGGVRSFTLPKPARYTILCLSSVIVSEGVLFYWCLKNLPRYVLRRSFKKILQYDRSLFVIVDMEQTKLVWRDIKSAMNDAKMAQKVEEFFGII